MSTVQTRVVALLIALGIFSVPELARAIPDYPKALREATGAPCVLPCTVCHRDNAGGEGTVIKPFGDSMIEHGLDEEDPALIKVAVDAMRRGDCLGGSKDAGTSDGGGSDAGESDAGGTELCPNGLPPEPVDSDGDGVSNIDELAAGRDPNIPGDTPVCPPEYGCGARVEPDGKLDIAAVLLALGAAAALIATWRRR